MTYHLYTKAMPFDNWSQDWVVNEVIKQHLTALYSSCNQCCMRPVTVQEISHHLEALGEDSPTVKALGEMLVRCLDIEIQSLRYHDVMWCVERIRLQFGE